MVMSTDIIIKPMIISRWNKNLAHFFLRLAPILEEDVPFGPPLENPRIITVSTAIKIVTIYVVRRCDLNKYIHIFFFLTKFHTGK